MNNLEKASVQGRILGIWVKRHNGNFDPKLLIHKICLYKGYNFIFFADSTYSISFPYVIIPFHMFIFSTMGTFDFIIRLGPSFKLVMVFLSFIPTSFSTFYDEDLCIFCVISLPSCLFIIQISLYKLRRECTIQNKVTNSHNKSFPTVW